MAGEVPRIIIINGVGSVGKTSTALALQQLLSTPFLYVAMDGFIAMLPPRMFGHPDGMVFNSSHHGDKRVVAVTTGTIMAQALRGMRHAIRAMAAQGNNLIVDDVMVGQGEAAEYRLLLAEFDVRFVGLHAPLDVLEERERRRGDREIGLARGQIDRVHVGIRYDLKIDTAHTTPEINAQAIRAAFNLT